MQIKAIFSHVRDAVQIGNLSNDVGDLTRTAKRQRFRACLRGLGDPGLVGLVSFVFTL